MLHAIRSDDNSGIRVLINEKVYFLPYSDYPVFEHADTRDIANLQEDRFGNLHWPALDADIELDALSHPEKYPLKDNLSV